MKEIEIKFQLSDKAVVVASLEDAGIDLGEEVFQEDTIYSPTDWKVGSDSFGVPFLRVRTQGGTSILTMKKRKHDNHLEKIEHETVVESGEEMNHIIQELDYKLHARVRKHRRKTKHQKTGYEICVDTVEGLGDFIELETLADDDADGAQIQDEMRAFIFDILGGSEGLEEKFRGYDILINQKL